ncbi:unnamed protein product [Vitrella brassicaformis CCMP3155]|uniref:Uncharacterized protein n=1 Tax=Vitrella brassicaformis (strain CCMP3155) TaxID=1169540 RepID=A0A0G4FTA4_VITBC|nr:unnamed protein product [Vitrella brassicaformis CCMP3155]|eukprot:CEM17708.1 unnamed protein product [Vitrella brassicaformis CCMP3155]
MNDTSNFSLPLHRWSLIGSPPPPRQTQSGTGGSEAGEEQQHLVDVEGWEGQWGDGLFDCDLDALSCLVGCHCCCPWCLAGITHHKARTLHCCAVLVVPLFSLLVSCGYTYLFYACGQRHFEHTYSILAGCPSRMSVVWHSQLLGERVSGVYEGLMDWPSAWVYAQRYRANQTERTLFDESMKRLHKECASTEMDELASDSDLSLVILLYQGLILLHLIILCLICAWLRGKIRYVFRIPAIDHAYDLGIVCCCWPCAEYRHVQRSLQDIPPALYKVSLLQRLAFWKRRGGRRLRRAALDEET